jgi:hypothetical protein
MPRSSSVIDGDSARWVTSYSPAYDLPSPSPSPPGATSEKISNSIWAATIGGRIVLGRHFHHIVADHADGGGERFLLEIS